MIDANMSFEVLPADLIFTHRVQSTNDAVIVSSRPAPQPNMPQPSEGIVTQHPRGIGIECSIVLVGGTTVTNY